MSAVLGDGLCDGLPPWRIHIAAGNQLAIVSSLTSVGGRTRLTTVPPMMPIGSGGLMQQNLPPELAQMREAALRSRQAGANQPVQKPATPEAMSASDARKELTAMGLQYYSQEQFIAAIRRGDTLAVDLYLTGGGVDLNAGSAGKTPLAIADASNQSAIAGMLRKRGAQ